jgi:FlaA1/EpsC-like NDP-sugar epimerase
MWYKIKFSILKFIGEYFLFFDKNLNNKTLHFSDGSTLLLKNANDYKMQDDREVNDEKLRRKKIFEDLQRTLDDDFFEEVILVTGAAGFVGSEVCRHLVSYPLKKLILLDQLDSELYDIEQELILLNPYLEIESILGDIKEFKSLERIFINECPSLVFHAAAYKDILLLEANPFQAVGTNVLGTKKLADLSVIYKVKKFLFVSTDEALCSANVMGASKRVAEKYLEYLEKYKISPDTTKFIITRCENIQFNRPSNKINRGSYSEEFFCIGGNLMKVSNSCKLIIDTCKMGKGGEIFTIDSFQNVFGFESLGKNIVEYSNTSFNELFSIENLINIKPTCHPNVNLFVSKNIDHVVFNHEFNVLCKIWKNKTDDSKLIRQLFKITKEDKYFC